MHTVRIALICSITLQSIIRDASDAYDAYDADRWALTFNQYQYRYDTAYWWLRYLLKSVNKRRSVGLRVRFVFASRITHAKNIRVLQTAALRKVISYQVIN